MLYETRRVFQGFRLKLTFDESLNKDMFCIFIDVLKTPTVGLLLNDITERFQIPHNCFLTVQNAHVLPSESVLVFLDVNSIKINVPSAPTAEVRGTQTSAVSQKESTAQESDEVISCNEGDVVDGKLGAFLKPRPPKRPIREGIAATIRMLREEEEIDRIGKECSELNLSNDMSEIQPTSLQETMNVDDDGGETNLHSEELSGLTSDACSDLSIERKKRKRKRKHTKNHKTEDQPSSSPSITEPVREWRQHTNKTHQKHIRFDDADDESQGAPIDQQRAPIMSQQPTNHQMSNEQSEQLRLQHQQVVQPVDNLDAPLTPVVKSSANPPWRGILEWQDGIRNLTDQVTCFVKFEKKDLEFDLNVEHWPPKFRLLFVPKELIALVGTSYIKNSDYVSFNTVPGKSADSLFNLMSSGYFGVIQLDNTPAELSDSKVIIVLFHRTEKLFVGFIPKDRSGFFDCLRFEIPKYTNSVQQRQVLNVASFLPNLEYGQSDSTSGKKQPGISKNLLNGQSENKETSDQSSVMESDDISSAEISSCFNDQSSQKSTKNQVKQSAASAHPTNLKYKNNYNHEANYHRPKASLSPYNGRISNDQKWSVNSQTNSDNPVSSFIDLPRLSESENEGYKPKYDRVEKELATLLMCKQLNTSMEYTVKFANEKGNSFPSTSPPSSRGAKNGPINQLTMSQPNQSSKKSDPSNSICQNIKTERNYENDRPERMEASSDDCEFLKQVKLEGTRIRLRKPDGTWSVVTPEIADTELAKMDVPKENLSIVFRIVYLNQNCIPTSSLLLYGRIVSYKANTNKLAIDIPHQFVEAIAKDCEDQVLPETIVPITGSTFEVDLSTLVQPKLIS